MTPNEVFEVLEELNLPIAYDHFAEGESPDPPFLCFLYPRNHPTGADNTVYYQLHELDIELYACAAASFSSTASAINAFSVC